MSTILNVLRPVVRSVIKPIDSRGGARYAYNMDGIDDRWTLANRAINVEQDIDIEFYTPISIAFPQTNCGIVMQCISATPANREFELFFSGGAGNLGATVGGSAVVVALAGTFAASTKYRWTLVGNQSTFYDAVGNIIRTTTITRGAAREPSAATTIGARFNGSNYLDFFIGIQRDIKINGTLWPMADRNQSIQLPEPSGLGAELITQSVLENPAAKGTQWTYLGNGRWQYIGDGTLNELTFILAANQPASGFVEFEIESISGPLTCANNVNPQSIFNTVGVKRYFYTTKAGNNWIEFKRVFGSVSCIIKNISFKPLGTCNPMTGANLNPDRWVEIPK